MIKYDIEEDMAYIGLNSLFYFLELYTLEIDLKNMRVFGNIAGKNIDVKFNENEAFVMENSIYANLTSIKEKLNFKVASFDFSMLAINLVPNFTLPYKVREKSKIERLRLEQEGKNIENIDISMPPKLIAPGFAKVNWYKYDLKRERVWN